MEADEFYGIVQERSHADTTERARTATEAVLETLAETLTAGESEDVARQLPSEVAAHLETSDHDGAGYDREAFVHRVGEHLQGSDLEPDEADRYAEGVTDAVAATLTQGERQDLQAQLADDLGALFEDVDVDREAI